MSTNYTHGPWHIEASVVGERESYIIGGNNVTIGWLRQYADTPANSALISAAPDLFVELQQASAMLHYIMEGGSYQAREYFDKLWAIDKVLSKAVRS